MKEKKILSMTENRVIVHFKTCFLLRFPRNFVWMTKDCLYIDNAECRHVWTTGSPAKATVCPEIMAVHTVQALMKLQCILIKGPVI